MSPRLATTVESCTAAALSTDARDKYFVSYVGEGSPWAGRQGGSGKGRDQQGCILACHRLPNNVSVVFEFLRVLVE